MDVEPRVGGDAPQERVVLAVGVRPRRREQCGGADGAELAQVSRAPVDLAVHLLGEETRAVAARDDAAPYARHRDLGCGATRSSTSTATVAAATILIMIINITIHFS